jgi:metallophosphoesterase superfamily enzyme
MQGFTEEQIAKETGLHVGQVIKRIESYQKRNPIFAQKAEVQPLTGDTHPLHIETSKLNTADFFAKLKISDFVLEDTLKEEDDFFKLPDGRDDSLYLYKNADKQRDKIQKYIEEKYKGQPLKVLYMADLHIPFTVYDLVKKIIREHSDADVLVLNGDILDLFNVSTFAKDKSIALKRELQEGRDFLEVVSKIFKDVIVVEGNHERRLRRYIQNVVPVDMHFLFPQDVLEVIQQGHVFDLNPLDNVHVVGSWWIQIYDAIFGHPDNYSSVPMRTVIQTSEHFKMVKNRPHRAMIIGHTHQAGKLIDRNTLVMETGCLQHDVDYKHGSKFIKTTWTRAHAVLYFDSQNAIDFNDSNVIIL